MYTGSAAKYNRNDHGVSSPLATAYYEPIKRTPAAAGAAGHDTQHNTHNSVTIPTPEQQPQCVSARV